MPVRFTNPQDVELPLPQEEITDDAVQILWRTITHCTLSQQFTARRTVHNFKYTNFKL